SPPSTISRSESAGISSLAFTLQEEGRHSAVSLSQKTLTPRSSSQVRSPGATAETSLRRGREMMPTAWITVEVRDVVVAPIRYSARSIPIATAFAAKQHFTLVPFQLDEPKQRVSGKGYLVWPRIVKISWNGTSASRRAN